MKTNIFALLFFVLASTASAQTDNQKVSVSGSVYVDLFLGPDGDVIYPQYTWKIGTKVGDFTGYGFLERAPREPLFTNHVNSFTPAFTHSKLSLRTELGGPPRKSGYFFQVGPQANVHQIIPPLKKAMDYLIVAQLPKLAGELRSPNTLIAGATKQFTPVTFGVGISFEGYRRFFPGNRPDYGEYWLLVHTACTKPVSFGVFALQDGRQASVGIGIRVTKP